MSKCLETLRIVNPVLKQTLDWFCSFAFKNRLKLNLTGNCCHVLAELRLGS